MHLFFAISNIQCIAMCCKSSPLVPIYAVTAHFPLIQLCQSDSNWHNWINVKVKSGWSGSRMRNECGRGAVITNSRLVTRLINHNEGYFYPEQWFALQPKKATNSKRGVETTPIEQLDICLWLAIFLLLLSMSLHYFSVPRNCNCNMWLAKRYLVVRTINYTLYTTSSTKKL